MPTLRNIKHRQKTVLPLSTYQWLCGASWTRDLQNHRKRRKALRNIELSFKLQDNATVRK